MTENDPQEHRGIASLFSRLEIKSFLKNYLIFIGIVEAVIFFVSFIGQLGPESRAFPWKSYFFAAFIIPVAITFLLGIFVVGFNKYLYGHNPLYRKDAFEDDPEAGGAVSRIQTFLRMAQQLPFMLTLLLLCLGAGIVYKLDAIFAFLARAGEKSAQYLLVSLGVLLAVGAVFGVIWMILNYRLQRQAIRYRHQYKKEVVERMGLLILEDDTVIDKEGQVISEARSENSEPDTVLLPPVVKRLKATRRPATPLPPRIETGRDAEPAIILEERGEGKDR